MHSCHKWQTPVHCFNIIAYFKMVLNVDFLARSYYRSRSKNSQASNVSRDRLGQKMTDRNNDMKFAFLSQETVPDYRTLDVSFFV